jgi:hypothetical protein
VWPNILNLTETHQQQSDSSVVEIPYIRRVDQLADMMTHVITSGPFHISLSKLGMCDIYVPAWGGGGGVKVYNCQIN